MKKYIFEDYPKKKSINFYNEKRKIIKKFFQNDNNLLSVYEYGKTKAPGISDLDIILIFKDNLKTKNLNKKKYDLINIDSELYDLVKFGNVIKMGLNTFNNIQYFDKFNLKNIVGKKIKTLIPTNNEIEVIKQISINDWIPERLLRLNSIIKSNKIKISNTLCVLNSICYSLKYLKKKVDKNKNINFIINETKILRTRWYKINNPEKRLILLINYTISNTLKLYYDYSKIFTILHKEAKLLKNLQKDIYYEIKKNNYIIFTNDNNKILYQISKSAKKTTYNYIYIPIIFYLHFFIQANQKGSLSKIMNNKINSKIKLKPKLNSSYVKLLINKFNLAEENKNFLKFYKIKKGLIRYGFHYE